ncbi:MAG: SRPBCC domain-containing protein [Nocardioides sp.]
MTPTHYLEAAIEADPTLPMIRITRDFQATPAQLIAAHTDPLLFRRWVGPDGMDTEILAWDARDGGEWRYLARHGSGEYHFRGCFHQITDTRIVQTFTFEAMPDDVALETISFEDLGDGVTRLHAQSLVDSFEGRDAWLASGMETGVNQGYAKLDTLLAGAR